MKFWAALLACMLTLATVDAEAARRVGGGQSIGQQSGNVSQRQAAASPAAPAPASAQAQSAAAKPAAAPAAPRGPWGTMVGALVTGLGLAWLAQALGLGAEFAQFLLFALLALVLMAVAGAVLRARRSRPAAVGGAYALQGAGPSAELAATPRQYSPDKVGNDASARPWEQQGAAFDAARPQGLRIGSAVGGAAHWHIPAGFDAAGFVEAAKRNFVLLQDAWDRADIATLRSMMTDEMVAEVRSQLAAREGQRNAPPHKTEVVMLEAQLLGIEERGEGYLASIEFSGMIREEPSAGPGPFREVWNMSKPRDGSRGWLVAGVQAMQ